MSSKPRRAYGELRDILEWRDGSMRYQRAGYRYGAWILTLNDKTKVLESTGRKTLPQLDKLYIPMVPNPKTWDDYTHNLVPCAEAKLLDLLDSDPNDLYPAEGIETIVQPEEAGEGATPLSAVAPNVDIESIRLSNDEIDALIRDDSLRIGMVETDNKKALTRRRRGQERLRQLTLLNYGSICALCDVKDEALLVTSHIVGWAELPEARGMLSNTICLCRFHDALFETGYWSLSNELEVLRKLSGATSTVRYLLRPTIQFRKPYDHLPRREFIVRHRECHDFDEASIEA